MKEQAVEAMREALVAIAAWKINDERKRYPEIGDDLRVQFYKAHDLLVIALDANLSANCQPER